MQDATGANIVLHLPGRSKQKRFERSGLFLRAGTYFPLSWLCPLAGVLPASNRCKHVVRPVAASRYLACVHITCLAVEREHVALIEVVLAEPDAAMLQIDSEGSAIPAWTRERRNVPRR